MCSWCPYGNDGLLLLVVPQFLLVVTTCISSLICCSNTTMVGWPIIIIISKKKYGDVWRKKWCLFLVHVFKPLMVFLHVFTP